MATTSAIDLLQEVELLRKSERELQMQLAQQRRKEGKLVFRLAVKERETRALQLEAASLRKANTPVRKQVTELLMDPAINAEMARLREELEAAQRKAKELQQELEATQFQSGSIMGKKLLQKCKELQEENEQLGKELAEGPVQKLRAEAALQKEFAQEVRKSLVETREWVEQLCEELEVAQAVIFTQKREINVLKQSSKPTT